MSFSPFEDHDSFHYLKKRTESIQQEIMELEDEYVLKASQTELEDYFINKAYICPLVLDLEAQYIKKYSSDSVDVPPGSEKWILWGTSKVRGTRVSIAIPYRGDKDLWRVRPSKFSLSGYPEIEVLNDEIIISVFFQNSSESSESVKSEIERQVSSIAEAVEALRQDVGNHNKKSINMIKSTLERRRQLAENTMGIIKGLGIPIKRQDAPLTYTLPTKRRASPLSRPPVSSEPLIPEPVLMAEEYRHIINVLQSMGHSIERNARSFRSLKEEVLRDFFLLVLNGHYQGTATGETFNASGKTDILIRAQDRNVFIAECKFWGGAKSFVDALDQLFGYLTWRDTKCALIVFNRNRDASGVITKMHDAMESHPSYRRTLSFGPEGRSEYIFVKESDPGREMRVTTLLFDLSD